MTISALATRVPVLRRFVEPRPVVPVLRLAGMIGGTGRLRWGMNLVNQAPMIERAFKVPRAKAVALSINSPGGSAVQAALIAGRIRALADEKEIPVVAFTEDAAASGGYWLACAADEIYVQEASIVGSIGVVSAGFGFPELLSRIGVERRVYTAGERKAMLDPFRAEAPDEVAHLKAIQEDIHESFKAYVRTRRGARLKADEATLFNGEFWTGKRAVELGLVDGLGDLRQTMRARFGEKVRLRWVDGPRRRWRLPLALGGGGAEFATAATALVEAVEERALWARYGL